MSVQYLVIDIEGREAIPVRAIPYITGWRLSPDSVAQQLSGDAETAINVLGGMTAYRLHDNVPLQVLPKEWDAILASLSVLQHQLQMQYPEDENDHVSSDFGYAAWREQSPFKLPADIFVWKDEFEPAFHEAYSLKSLIIAGERHGDRELVYAPLLPEGVTIGSLLGVFSAKRWGQVENVPVSVEVTNNRQPEIPSKGEKLAQLSEADCKPPAATTHNLRSRTHALDAEIEQARKGAVSPDNAGSVWAEMQKMAENKVGALVGVISEGLQYRGRQHQESGEPDVFTLKNLRDRMGRRAKAR